MGIDKNILIVGAGIGGLCAASALAQKGFQVDVFEQAQELGDVGAGLQLSPNAMLGLSTLGVKERIHTAGFEPLRAAFRDYRSGKIELSVALKSNMEASYGQPYYHIHRADLHSILSRRALELGVNIHLGSEITALSQSDKKAHLSNKNKDFDGIALIGADGIHSAVHAHLIGKSSPKFTGNVAWRGLVPVAAVSDNMIPPDATVWMGPRRHLVTYYVRGGKLINFVAVEERKNWTEDGWNIPGDIDELRQAFARWDAPVVDLLSACEECYLWGLFDHAPLPTWVKGRIALLGDACHPMLPFVAQGAAMAIEDAIMLAENLSKDRPVDVGLKAYETARKPRTTRIQSISRSNARLYHHSSIPARYIRKFKFKAAQTIPSLARKKLEPIYGGFKL